MFNKFYDDDPYQNRVDGESFEESVFDFSKYSEESGDVNYEYLSISATKL